MSELLDRIGGEVSEVLEAKKGEVATLESVLAAVGSSNGTATVAVAETPTKRKYTKRKGGKRRGRRTDAEKAAELGISVEQYKAQK